MNKKQQRQQKMLRQQEIVNAAKEAGRDLTAEEQTEFDSLQREIERLNGEIEAEEQQQRGMNPPANAPPQNPANPEADTQRAIQEERARIRSITELCGEFGMEARSYIESGATLDSVREAALEHVRQHGAPIPANGRVSITESAEDKFRAAAADAIVMRSGMELQNPADGARQMMGMTLRDLAIECLTNEGQSGLNRRSSDELYGMLQRQFYNPTAAFPAILDNAINKAYVEGHKTVAVTFDQWTKKGTLKDFKTHDNNYLAGPVGEFLEVPEGGELKHDVFGDEKLPTRKLKTYGRQFTLTRQASATRLAKKMERSKEANRGYFHRHIEAMLSYMGWFTCTDTYDCYQSRIKPYIHVGRLKKIISKIKRRQNHEGMDQGKMLRGAAGAAACG